MYVCVWLFVCARRTSKAVVGTRVGFLLVAGGFLSPDLISNTQSGTVL